MNRHHLTAVIALLLAVSFVTTATAADASGLLVSVDELNDRLDDPDLRILDVRSREAYEAGHIPAAAHVDLNDWKSLALSKGGLNDESAWAERIGKVGITSDTPVVVYADRPTNATRAWWTLKYVGVEQAAVLNGGWSAWQQADGPVSQDEPQIAATEFTPQFQANRLAEIGDVKSVLDEKSVTIVDTRSDDEHTGTAGPGPRLGHIPGAVHQEWTEFVDEDGRFKSVDQIQERLAKHGLTAGDTHITHCQTGGRASLNAFAMELAGYGPVKNYYCGWSEWSADEDAPIE